MTDTTTLAPCPFCGGATRHLEERTGFWTERAICDTCNFHLTRTHTESAVTRWNRRAPTAPPAQEARDGCTLSSRIAELTEQHGSLRAAARSLDFDPGYLARLQSGEKCNPSPALLERLGLRQVITYVRGTT